MYKIVITSQGLSQLKLIPKSTLNPKISINFELHDSSETHMNRFSPKENREIEKQKQRERGLSMVPLQLEAVSRQGWGTALLGYMF